MTEFVDFFLSQKTPHILVGAHFLLYALLAWIMIAVCCAQRNMTREKWLLLSFFMGYVALECLQLGFDGYFRRQGTMGLARYIGVFSPLLWVWAAWALIQLWYVKGGATWKWSCRLAVVVSVGWVLLSEEIGGVKSLYNDGVRLDVERAAANVVPIIKADYAGPMRQAESNKVLGDYFSTRRPVVFSDIAAAAWALRGQSEGAVQDSGLCPYPPDYLFFRLVNGYGRTADMRKYDIVTAVPGIGTQWLLLRRKGVPHKMQPKSD